MGIMDIAFKRGVSGVLGNGGTTASGLDSSFLTAYGYELCMLACSFSYCIGIFTFTLSFLSCLSIPPWNDPRLAS